jgi:hypothetical protein
MLKAKDLKTLDEFRLKEDPEPIGSGTRFVDSELEQTYGNIVIMYFK